MVSLHTSPLAAPGSADAGGMNVVELNTALALASRGHSVDLLTRRDSSGLAAMVEIAPRVRVFNLDAGPAESVAKSAQEPLIDPFRHAMGRWFSEHGAGVDLVHSHHWFSGVAALPIAHHYALPHLQSFHSVAAPPGAGLDAGEAPESAGRRAGERLVAVESDLVIAVSEAEKRSIIERYHPPAGSVAVVRPGVDLAQFRPLAPGERSWAWQGCYLFFAARLQPLKAPDLAIRTLATLPVGQRPRLVIAGEASADFASYADELRELVTELGVADEVLFLGSLDRAQLATMLRGACALLNPSRSETYGLINLEASASGTPVVATRVGGMSESVIDGRTGILLDSREPADWAAAVHRFTADAGVRDRFGKAGREFAETRGWAAVAAELEDVYRQVV